MLTQQLSPAATVAVLSLWTVMYNKLSMVRESVFGGRGGWLWTYVQQAEHVERVCVLGGGGVHMYVCMYVCEYVYVTCVCVCTCICVCDIWF